ncbi:hypothetical protein Bca52824_075676 [Brassica carinata]|uniref:Uncharacterized protein n=1 Tax=Brassica carinata TaxID=52824 RepID=A0A8X7TVY4_BRACI|nr:hypothetical protein Bca52824_075676 [Brassica carinata]
MTEREAYVKMVVAHAKAMEANNEFAAILEKCLQDVPRSDELNEIKKVVRELKLGLKMAQDRERANAVQLAVAKKLGNQAATLEACLRFADDLRRAIYDAKRVMADSYLEVLVASDCEARLREVMSNIDLLKEIMNNNLLASDELLWLQAKEVELGSEVDVMATSDFSIGSSIYPRFRRICQKISSLRFLLRRIARRSARMTVLPRLLAELAATEDLIRVLVFGQL